MKTKITPRILARTGSALALTMVMTGIALAILASAMTWSANSTRLTHRSIQYTRSVAAAEAATEKVLTRINKDFLTGGEKLVGDNLASYRLTVPKSSDSSYWNQWEFSDGASNINQIYVERGLASNYITFGSTYAGLRGYVTTYSVVAHARDTASMQDVVAGVIQEAQLTRVPVFQFAMYSSGDMEISCGRPLAITGRVHANKTLYVEPDDSLTFKSYVTAVTDILFKRAPFDTRGNPSGSVVYQVPKETPVAAMTLPIGTTNTPQAIREIIQPPGPSEDPNSPIGRLRYYNQADMIITVSNSGVTATSGRFDNFTTLIPSNQLRMIVTTTNSFRDAREGKTVRPVDIYVNVLTEWSQTNTSLRGALGNKDLSSVYVVDRRTLAGTELASVRVRNGTVLPGTAGLTVATARPLYVLGNYNQTNPLNLGTTNTITTKPASLVADAVTILSPAWSDANSTAGVASRVATPITVNAAILTGVVETTSQPSPLTGYSGGMENFPRFLETWGSTIVTYNGSMVRMFPSLYATNAWGKDQVYSAPTRNWAFDLNFYDANKLPPLTPCLVYVFRGQWATVAPNKNVAMAP